MLNLRAVLLVSISALLPVSVGAGAEPADQQGDAFVPPKDPMILTRTVWRGLHDGKAISVTRAYSVTIQPDGDGYLVTGTLIDTTVEAPPQVAALAELERKRVETGVFPFRLDRQGRISNPAASVKPDPGHAEVARTGHSIVAASPLPAATRQETRSMLDEVIGASRAGVAWPADLFNPVSNQRQQKRDVVLPNGGKGEVAVSIRVDRARPGQLPRSVERTITTSLGGTENVIREQWTMGPR